MKSTDQKLIQFRIPEEIKNKTDDIFKAENGISTQAAARMILIQVATTGKSPIILKGND